MYTNRSKIKKKKEGNQMATTVPTQIRIEENTKRQAVELLEGLGLNLSDDLAGSHRIHQGGSTVYSEAPKALLRDTGESLRRKSIQ